MRESRAQFGVGKDHARMTATIVNDLNGLFMSQALDEAASQLGESKSSVMRGFETAAAAIIGALTSHLGQSGFLKQAFELITNPVNDGGVLSNVHGFFSKNATAMRSDGWSGPMLSMLFGGNQSTVVQGISESSGLRPSSASALMAAAASMVFGILGRRVKENHLDAAGLSNMLRSEKSAAGPIEIPSGSSEHAFNAQSNRWLLPLAFAVLGVGGAIWMVNHGTRVVNQAAYMSGSTAGNLGSSFQRTLPNGIPLSIPRFGMESELLRAIQNDSPSIANRWFDFDRLSFESNSATLRPESTEQLANLAHILNAYPTVHLMIGGFTGNMGDAELQLSQARANSVMQQLTKMGIDSSRLEARSFGGAATAAGTEAGRLRNRGIALRITAQ
jgi:OmpA-OmpF porin, OOP family